MRLDRLIRKWGGLGKRQVRSLLERGVVEVNGQPVQDGTMSIGKFDRVEMEGVVVQSVVRRVVLLNKPSGVVSATRDAEHPTVIELIDRPWASELHLAGRLDRFTTGLMILTNDGEYSESLTDPANKVGKRYLVTVDGEINEEIVRGFESGMWFAREKVKTAPAIVELLDQNQCRLTIYEGKHHQVKRMFACFSLKVTSLHREAIGVLELPEGLGAGEWMEL